MKRERHSPTLHRRLKRLPAVLACALVVAACAVPSPDASAFTRGLASKVRAMQRQAYQQRLSNAQEAFAARDYDRAIQEGLLALEHASTDTALARPAHELLASAYQKKGDRESAAAHKRWLQENR